MKIIFTKHARARMQLRSITRKEVLETLKNPDIEKNIGGGKIQAEKKQGKRVKLLVKYKPKKEYKIVITIFRT